MCRQKGKGKKSPSIINFQVIYLLFPELLGLFRPFTFSDGFSGVAEACAKISAENGPRGGKAKRKEPLPSAAPTAPAAKKSKQTQLGSLRKEYQRGRSSNFSQMSQRSQSASSARSASAMSVDVYSDPFPSGAGGLASDDDDGNEAEWARARDEQNVGRGLENLSKASPN
ncbi:hypothetical protein K438DRAFT_1748554 [Mycena galopus ATCC 62051]|nr:hypothetical protein K438DRAFT_1748554 [Mycena galopus ATCC 62051]